VVTFSSIAVPGTNGFIGEFLVLLGSFKSTLPLALSVAATTCVVLGAAYMLWMVQKVFFGTITHQENLGLKDLNGREIAAAVPLVILILVMGLRPQPFLELLNPSTAKYLARAQYGASGQDPTTEDAAVRITVRQLPPKPAADNAPPMPLPRFAPAGAVMAIPNALKPSLP